MSRICRLTTSRSESSQYGVGRVVTVATALAGLALLGASQLSSSASAVDPFVPGVATGTAQALAVAPHTGGFAYTITAGGTVADFRGSLAQAESQSLDLGLIGTSITTDQCDGSDPPVQRSQLPQPLIAESDHGDVSKTRNSTGVSRSGVLAVGGRLHVSALTQPRAQAGFDGGVLSVPGLVEATGLTSSSGAQLRPGVARLAEAQAQVRRLSLLGGTVVFDDLHWQADQRSGHGAGAHGSFTAGRVTVAGRAIPVDGGNLGAVSDRVNAALADTGLHVTMPQVKRTGTAKVSVTPLSLGIENSKLGGQLINPILTAAGPVRDAVVSAILGISCKFGNALTLGDIVLSALNGTGGLSLQFGGVTADSDGTSYDSPFGSPTTMASVPPVAGTHGSTGTAAAPPTAAGSPPGVDAATAPPAAAAAPQLAGASHTTSTCASTSDADWPSCSNGAALAAGLIALAAVLTVGGADWFVTRRRRRLPVLDL